MLTSEQKKQFDQDGVVCLRGVLSSDDIEALRGAVERQISQVGQSQTGYDFETIARHLWAGKELDQGAASRFNLPLFKSMVDGDPDSRPLIEADLSDSEGQFFYDVAAWKSEEGVRHVAFDSALPELVAELLDARFLHFWEDTTFVKAPGTRQKTAFHQDISYFQIDGTQCVIVWIPLDPADLANGVTEYVRGSHRWNETYAPNVFVSQTPLASSPEKRCPDIEGNRADFDIVSFDVQPGDVIVHHVMTVHGAGGNMSSNWRRAMSFRYCGDQVRYLNREGAIQQVGVSHELKDGDPLFSEDYPVVWPKPWPSLKLSSLYGGKDLQRRTSKLSEVSPSQNEEVLHAS